MSPGSRILIPAAAIVFGLLLYASTFTVQQWDLALKLRLGEIIDSSYDPGLHWMVPLLNEVKKFDGRIQTLDTRPERFLTVEKKDVIVDSYIKWRIADVAKYFRSTGGNQDKTSRLLTERINTNLRDEFGKRTIQQVIAGERSQIMEMLTSKSDSTANELGVEIIDVRVKRIDLPPEVSESVYERMRAERGRVARDLRAKGSEAGERIRADVDRQRTETLANAYREAEQLRGEGDAKASEIFAQAFQRNREFYSFYRSLNAYRSAFERGDDLLVLTPDSGFFRYFNSMSGQPAR
jgi:modulator of FtsH protease HflC